jgi:murein L,D-transpeptidase YcbB/YkuD
MLLAAGFAAPDFYDWLLAQAPATPAYTALANVMADMERLADQPWPQLETAGLIRPDKQDARVPEIRQRLALLGDYRVVRPNSQADRAAAMDSPTYDPVLVAAVERFQRRHGLEDDGIVGPKTVTAMNMSPAERVQTIAVNLERLRWMPDPAGVAGRHIVINVAGFELVAYLDGERALSMPVIVGQPRHKTPLLADQIVNVKFAPTWTVPDRIARRELLPKIQNDPGYLAANNFRVFLDHGATVEVNPAEVDWASLSSSYMPYMLRQDSGPSNALGMIRFSLSNDLNIYLHDTGSRQLFAEAERSLSHGCIRVGAPVELADFALDGLDKAWTPDEIETAMSASSPHFQRLAAPVLVDLVYVTAWVDGDGTVNFRKDIYGYDSTTAEQLRLADSSGPEAIAHLIEALGNQGDTSTVTAALEADQI